MNAAADPAGFALRWSAAALLFAGIAAPDAARLVAVGLVCLAGAAFLRRGDALREVPPALTALLAGLLVALALAHFAHDAPAFDRPALRAVVTLLPALAPFYLADTLPPVDRLLPAALALAFARHFEAAVASLAAAPPVPLPPDAPFLAAHPTLALLLLACAPLLDRHPRPASRAALDAAWLFLALLCATPYHPGAAAALACGLALIALATRRPAALLRLALFLAGLLLAAATLPPGATVGERLAAAAPPPDAPLRALATLAPLLPEPDAAAGPGFSALRRRLATALPGDHLSEQDFARLPAALSFPLGPGIPFALLYLAFHLALLARLARAVKRVPRDSPARSFVAGALASTAGLTVLLFFTGVPALTGAAAPFLFLAGSAATLVARSTEPLPRRGRASADADAPAAPPCPPPADGLSCAGPTGQGAR